MQKIQSHLLSSLIFVALSLAAAGCQQRVAGKLVGTWVGRPDTTAARAEREAEKYGKRPDSEHPGTNGDATDWEAYDIEVRFDFVDQKHLNLSLADGSEPMSATWRVLETSPAGCLIELVTSGQEGKSEVRQFELEIDEREGTIIGFLLMESGADRQLGALYFTRIEN